jgi:hypothetical protein
MKGFDALFKEKEITEKARALPIAIIEKEKAEKRADARSLVLSLRFGSLYTVRAERSVNIRAALISDMEALACEPSEQIPFDEARDFICTPLKEGLSLVIETEDAAALRIFETPILLGHDTEDAWLYPEIGLHLEKGKEGCFGDLDWTAEELLAEIYEPLREKYPTYISRESIGFDESGKYEMYAYTFAPERYEKTLFITSGIHADNEFVGTLAFARFIEMICEEWDTHEGLSYLRGHVRLIVIPVVNVWSRGEAKCRRNSNGVDLNRDFADFSQAESRNVAALMRRYKDEIGCVLDLHCAGAKNTGLWYQFNVQAKNAAASFKCINHVAERLKALGYEKEIDLSKIPGKYIKSNAYLQGYAYNELGLANIVVEHNLGRWYGMTSKEAFAFAVECYANFIIQTALAQL